MTFCFRALMAAITALTAGVFFTYSFTVFLAIEKYKKTSADAATMRMGKYTFRYNVLFAICMLIFSILYILTDLIWPLALALLGFTVIVILISVINAKNAKLFWTMVTIKNILL